MSNWIIYHWSRPPINPWLQNGFSSMSQITSHVAHCNYLSIINYKMATSSTNQILPHATDHNYRSIIDYRMTSHVRSRSHDMHIASVISHDGISSRVLGIKSKKSFLTISKTIEYAILYVKLSSSLSILAPHSLCNLLYVLSASLMSLTASSVTISRMQQWHALNDIYGLFLFLFYCCILWWK